MVIAGVPATMHSNSRPDVEIYKCTHRENGHMYVGQAKTHRAGVYFGTTGRAKEHVSEALSHKANGSTALNYAICQHGPEAFQWNILHIVPAEEADAAEIAAIALYNTFEDPQHYNLTPGGQFVITPAMRQQQALTVRRHQQDRPIGISVLNNCEKQGYQVRDSVTGKQYRFTSSKKTMDEKLVLAEECLKQCHTAASSGTAPPASRIIGQANSDPTLPKYVSRCTRHGKSFLQYRKRARSGDVYKYFREASYDEQKAAAWRFVDSLAGVGKK